MDLNRDKEKEMNGEQFEGCERVFGMLEMRREELSRVHPEEVLLRAALGQTLPMYREKKPILSPYGMVWKMCGTASVALIVVLLVIGTRSSPSEDSHMPIDAGATRLTDKATEADFAAFLEEHVLLLQEIVEEENTIVQDAADKSAAGLRSIYNDSEELENPSVVEV